MVGPGRARVRVRAASLNYRDLVIARGAANRKNPLVPLSDTWCVRERFVLTRERSELPPAARALIEAIQRHFDPAS